MRTFIIIILTGCIWAQTAPERIAWNHTPEALAGHFVSVKLSDGTQVGGYWTSVTPNTFTMRVETSSNRRAFAHGVRKMPRASIVEVRAGERRVRGRVIGTIVGIYGVTLLAIQLPAGGGTLVAPVLGSVVGYQLGKAIDHRTREVILLPEDSQP